MDKVRRMVKRIKKKPLKKSFKLGKLIIPLKKRLDYNSKEWKFLQEHCEKRNGGKICIRKNEDCYGAMHLHHKKPLKNGGTNKPSNLEWICHLHHCIVHPFMIKLLIQKYGG